MNGIPVLVAAALAFAGGATNVVSTVGMEPVVVHMAYEEERPPFVRCDRDVEMSRTGERAPDGEKTLTFTLRGEATGPAHARGIRFNRQVKLDGGVCYRVRMWAKADRPLACPCGIASQTVSPWRNLGGLRFELAEEWKLLETVFRIDEDIPEQVLSFPFLMVGALPKGTRLTVGPLTVTRLDPFRLAPSADWRPVDMGRHERTYFKSTRIPEFEVKAGTALDLSRFVERFDIDRMGRIVANREGQLVFGNAPGKTVRLRGYNCTYGGGFDRFEVMDKREIEELADQVIRFGMNVVRLHFWDRKFVGMGGMKWHPFRNVQMEEAEMPETEEALRRNLDAGFMDRYHWFMKCLRDRGVYVIFDISTSTAMMVRAGKAAVAPRVQLLFNERFRNHWKACYGVWMNTVNPYTGKRPLDDPQYVAITFFNEQEHIFNPKATPALPKLTPLFRAACGADMPELSMALLREEGARGDAARAFMRRMIHGMNEFYLSVVRESGFRGFCLNWDMYMRNLEGDARRDFNAVAMHTYHAHPNQEALPKGFVPKNTLTPWISDAASVSLASSIVWNSYLAHASATRVLGKPFFLTEYSHAGGNRHAQEAPVVQTAAAALQDWQLLTPHANLVDLYHYEPFSARNFDSSLSVMARIASLATAFGWQRGDVRRAPHAVSFAVSEKTLAGRNYAGTIGCAYNSLVWLTRIGSNYSGERNPVAEIEVEPSTFATAADMGMWAKVNEEVRNAIPVCAEQVKILREKGILPPSNRTDAEKGIFESETGEVVVDMKASTATIDAPRFQAAALKPGTQAHLSALRVEEVSTPASILAISLENERPVVSAKRLLVVVATRFVPEGAVWQRRVWSEVQCEEGEYRPLMKAGRFRFSVKTSLATVPKVYALRMDGTRNGTVPVSLADGRLVFDLDTSTFTFGTPYFEVVPDADGTASGRGCQL